MIPTATLEPIDKDYVTAEELSLKTSRYEFTEKRNFKWKMQLELEIKRFTYN